MFVHVRCQQRLPGHARVRVVASDGAGREVVEVGLRDQVHLCEALPAGQQESGFSRLGQVALVCMGKQWEDLGSPMRSPRALAQVGHGTRLGAQTTVQAAAEPLKPSAGPSMDKCIYIITGRGRSRLDGQREVLGKPLLQTGLNSTSSLLEVCTRKIEEGRGEGWLQQGRMKDRGWSQEVAIA